MLKFLGFLALPLTGESVNQCFLNQISIKISRLLAVKGSRDSFGSPEMIAYAAGTSSSTVLLRKLYSSTAASFSRGPGRERALESEALNTCPF